jgi:hypothetical protein
MQEVKIRITDDACVTAQERARLEGFGSTEVFLSDLVVNSMISEEDNYDHLFTSERLAITGRCWNASKQTDTRKHRPLIQDCG